MERRGATSLAGALQKLASGNGAELIIQTFQTDPGPDAHKWVDKGYDHQLNDVQGAGYQFHGRQAIGVWLDDSQHALMHIELTMATSKPVVSLVESLATTAVPSFF